MPSFDIVISYRREDSKATSNSIYHELVRRFGPGRVLFDLTEIPVGQDYDEFVRGIISQAKALVVVIGPRWLSVKKKGLRRLDLESDSVRGEIAAALQARVPVIPLLVEGAQAPDPDALPLSLKPLAKLNMLSLADRYWDAEMDALTQRLTSLITPEAAASHVGAASHSRLGSARMTASLAAFILALAIGAWYYLHRSPNIYRYPTGFFEKTSDGWVEHSAAHPDLPATFAEFRRDSEYIYLVDSSRVKDGDAGNVFNLRIPLKGGEVQWSWSNPLIWIDFNVVKPDYK